MTNDPTLPPGIDVEYWFSAHEMADLAAEVEGKGAAFYRRLAHEVEAETVRDMCAFFAGQEEEHRQIFQTIAGHYRGQSAEFVYAVDIRAMLRASLEAIASLFANHADRLLDGGGIVGGLHLARRIEETSVAVYGHMRRTYTPRFAAVLAAIVAEEEEHLRMVRNVLAKLPAAERTEQG